MANSRTPIADAAALMKTTTAYQKDREQRLWDIRRMWILRGRLNYQQGTLSKEEHIELEEVHHRLMGYDLMGILIGEIPLFKGPQP